MLVVMLVAQLYSFEDFAPLLGQNMQGDDVVISYVAAALLVIAELFSLPYLLGMYISRFLRYTSAGLALGVSVYWLFTAFTNSHAVNTGLFSSTFVVSGGILAAAWAGLLVFLVVATVAADTRFRHASS